KNPKQVDKFHVLYCPTQQWHRKAAGNPNPDFGEQALIGYFYFPFRDPNMALNGGWGFNYDVTGLQNWVTKQKFGQDFQNAPIMADMKQAMGSFGSPNP